MPFDGSGNFSPAASPNFPAIGGEVISALYYNNVINDLAGGLSNALTRDGQGKPLVDMNWNGKNLTNAGTIGAVQGNFSGNVTVGGALTVTGSTNVAGFTSTNGSFTGTLGVSGVTTLNGTLLLGNSGFAFSSDGAQDTGWRWVSDGVMAGRADGVDRVTVNTAGVSVNGALAVAGAATVGGTATVGGILTANVVSNLIGQVNFGTTGHGNIGSDTNTIYVRGDTHAFQTANASATRMYIDSAGRVGIGHTNLNRTLDIFAADNWIRQANGGRAYLTGMGVSSSWGVYDEAASAQRLTLNSSGNFSIGVAPTSHRLQVGGDVGASNFRIGTQLTSEAGTFGFTNGNGPGVVAWGTATGGAGKLDLNVGGNTRLSFNTFGGITSSDLADAVGYKGLPQNAQGGAYTLVMADMGKHVLMSNGGVVALTIPPNSSVGFQLGTAVTIVNDTAAAKTITQGAGVTLVFGGVGTTGNRTLGTGGICTLLKIGTDKWYVSGAGLS